MREMREGSTPLVRTWFDDEDAWRRVIHEAVTLAQERGDYADVQIIDTVEAASLSMTQIVALAAAQRAGTIVVIADHEAMTAPGLPLLAVLTEDGVPVDQMRIVASEFSAFEVNVALLSNLDWEDYAHRVDPEGVFRGFR